jgi:hypothetical protein
LAITAPKWVRAYVAESDLAWIKPGVPATIAIDSRPGKAIAGKVGYVSSVAEFTPRTVQTEELRTSLVYEVRVLADDKEDQLRLGMPATVRLARNVPSAGTPPVRPTAAAQAPAASPAPPATSAYASASAQAAVPLLVSASPPAGKAAPASASALAPATLTAASGNAAAGSGH